MSAERERLEQERKELEKLEAEAAERQRIDAERIQIETSKKQILAMSNGRAKETRRDGRFIAYDNGTVKDTKTG